MDKTCISLKQLRQLTRESRLLESGPFGDKVRLTPDGYIFKYFYTKRLISSSLFTPYATRFCRNAEILRSAGVRSVHCEQYYYIAEKKAHVVVYKYIAGTTLRALLEEKEQQQALLQGMAEFLACLHNKGIYFRSTHFGNILVCDDNVFALIDITNLRRYPGALGPALRARNLKHILHAPVDHDVIRSFGMENFRSSYEVASGLSEKVIRQFRSRLRFFAPDFYRKDF